MHLNNDSKLIESIGMFAVVFKMYLPSSDVLLAFNEHVSQFITNRSFSTLLPIYIDINTFPDGMRECVLVFSAIEKARAKDAPTRA